jgi:hypothetical protein
MLGIVNFITFLASIPVLGGGIWLASRANSTDCIRFLQWPIIIIGLAVMVVSLMGFAGACYRQTWLLRIYLFAMFFIVIALLFFIVFAFAVTDRGEGQVVMNRRFLEYQLSDYNGWLRNRVADPQYWATIAVCLRDGHACASMRRMARDPNTGMLVPETPAMFFNRDLSPIQVPAFLSLSVSRICPCDFSLTARWKRFYLWNFSAFFFLAISHCQASLPVRNKNLGFHIPKRRRFASHVFSSALHS